MDREPLMTSQGAIFAFLLCVLVRTVFRLYNSGGMDTVIFLHNMEPLQMGICSM